MSLDKATVQRIAVLARIEVPPENLEPLARELSGIMGWIEQLQEVNTDNVAPMSGGTDPAEAARRRPWRKDEVVSGLTGGGIADKIVANAPDGVSEGAEGGAFFAVPKVVE